MALAVQIASADIMEEFFEARMTFQVLDVVSLTAADLHYPVTKAVWRRASDISHILLSTCQHLFGLGETLSTFDNGTWLLPEAG